jgi:hypothetical protein
LGYRHAVGVKPNDSYRILLFEGTN